MLTRDEVITWAIAHGYTADKYGHYQRTTNDRTIRLKLSSISMRYESKVKHSDGTSDWVRLRSGYYKNLSINDKGQICGLK